MDLSGFLSVLDKRALFFPSIATLSAIDPYEGEPALMRIEAARSQGADELRRLQLQKQIFSHLNFFSCWHMNDNESDAMWKIYLKSTEGVAIQSTVSRLKACFLNTPNTVYMGEVKYVDHGSFIHTVSDRRRSDYMYKRLAFQHEREVRAGTYRTDLKIEFLDKYGQLGTPISGTTIEDLLLFPERKGIYVDVDVSVLVDKVIVSPLSPDWFSDLVISSTKKLGYDFEVMPSEMSRPSALWKL
jgi:hypothetical protein